MALSVRIRPVCYPECYPRTVSPDAVTQVLPKAVEWRRPSTGTSPVGWERGTTAAPTRSDVRTATERHPPRPRAPRSAVLRRDVRYVGALVKRRVGPAWLEKNPATACGTGGKRAVPDWSTMTIGADASSRLDRVRIRRRSPRTERVERERRSRGVTFRELAHEYLRWLGDVKRAKPATLRDHGYVLREQASNTTAAGPLRGPRDGGARRPARVEGHNTRHRGAARQDQCHRFLAAHGQQVPQRDRRGLQLRVQTIHACVAANPARYADKREEPYRGALLFYTPEEVEAIARAFEEGRHRGETAQAAGERERRWPRITGTPNWSGSPPMRACGRASCWRCAGATWTSPARRSPWRVR